MAKRRRPLPSARATGPAWRAPALFTALVLAGGAPLGYCGFTHEALLGLRLGPFGLFPLMLWPGALALLFGGARDMGWRPPPARHLGAAILYPALLAPAAAGLALALGLGEVTAGAVPAEVASAWGTSVVESFATGVFMTLGEEMGWRGLLQRRLAPFGAVRSILGASAAATAYHVYALFAPGLRGMGPAALMSFVGAVFLLQVAAGILYRSSGSLWAPFVFHLLWNATSPVFTGNLYLGEPGLVTGTPWMVNGEGLCGALASLLLLGPLYLSVRAPAAPTGRVARWSFAAVLLGLIAAGAALAARQPDSPPEDPLRTDARAALDRALSWLDGSHDDLSVDSVFLLRLIQGAMPSSRAGALAERGLPAAQRDPTYRLFAELLESKRPPHPPRALPAAEVPGVPNPAQPFDEKFSDTCLHGALACRFAPGCREYILRLGQWGYVLSHQVLFFLFAREKGCDLGVDLDGWLGRLAAAMLREHTVDRHFSDLYAERMALGAYAGFRELLRPAWIREVLRAQDPSGCWHWSAEREGCNDHTTGMAAWVLALFLTGSPPGP